MIVGLFKSLLTMALRLLVVGLLIKSSLDIIAVNEETPRMIVHRSKYFYDLIRDNLGINLGYDCTYR
jgi:hypothetical protein